MNRFSKGENVSLQLRLLMQSAYCRSYITEIRVLCGAISGLKYSIDQAVNVGYLVITSSNRRSPEPNQIDNMIYYDLALTAEGRLYLEFMLL